MVQQGLPAAAFLQVGLCGCRLVEKAEARARESAAAVERLTSDLTETQQHEAAASAAAADAESRADVRSSSQGSPRSSS